MHLIKSSSKKWCAHVLLIFVATAIFSFSNANALSEEPSSEMDVVRSVENPSAQKVTLAQAVYRTEYEAREYQVEVPYDEVETYTEYEQVGRDECVPNNPPPGCTWQTVYTWEWVTKTRTITKYRTETRVDYIPYDVFDHWWTINAEFRYPAGTELKAGEQDIIRVKMAGSESKPKVEISQKNPIFKFSIASIKLQDKKLLIVELSSKPHITPKSAGTDSIGKLGLEFLADGVDIIIPDKIDNPRVVSDYTIKIKAKGSDVIIGETKTVIRQGPAVRAKIVGTFDAESDYVVDFSVARAGIVMTAPVQFNLSKEVKAEKLSMSALKDKEQVRGFAIKGIKEATQFIFKDRTEDYKTVRSQYGIQISVKKEKEWTVIAEKVFERDSLTNLDKEGAFILDLKKDLQVKDDVLGQLLKGATLKFQMTVRRTSKRIGEIKFDKSTELKITK